MDNPYNPPAANYGQYVSPQDAWGRYGGFVPLQNRMLVASLAIGLAVVASGTLDVAQLTFAGQLDGTREHVGAALIVGGSGLFTVLAHLAAALCYCLWLHRAASNVHAFGGYMTFSPGACVGWFFVPFANWVKPYRAVSELWVASHPRAHRTKSMLDAWWATWIISSFLQTAAGRISDMSLAGTIGLGGTLFTAIAAYFCIAVMRAISQGQLDGAERAGISPSQLR
ncbi:DUF4328 domain-containing protein [Pendulispora brunnea]|uniref:DUF4328 domain-containing protein n=1 Tax=Pendulispora brunnea TaxID=2905690 RepID=A0ABZ2KCH1_9BACT